MPEPLIPIQTIKYKTYVKEALVEALRAVFLNHPDPLLADTNVDIDFANEEIKYPAVIIRFFERNIENAGIGHYEYLPVDGGDPDHPQFIRYKHYLYSGDIEFAIYALSSLDRDLVSDSVVQTLTMADIEEYTNAFLNRIYNADPIVEPSSINHMINLNTDRISGFGETQQIAPWGPEDVLVYQTAYRIEIKGEFYSRAPNVSPLGLVEKVDLFPYMPVAGEEVPDPPAPGPDGEYGTADDQPDAGVWQ